MKYMRFLGIFITLVVVFVSVIPVSAQLGDTDTSTFTVQNVSGGSADVTVTFFNEAGVSFVPTDLGGSITNPFNLVDGASKQVNVANIPLAQLPSGRYSLVITSTAQVIAQAGLAGSGAHRFGGAYSAFSTGATTVYIPTAAFNLYGWYSMFTVQNLGTLPADVTITIKCTTGVTGTLTQLDIPSMSSYTWATKNVTPTGFTGSTVCDGSAVITSDQNIVAINNQNNPSTGATNSFEGAYSGGNPVYVPNLSKNFYGWNSNLTITKLDAGATTVTISYSDGDADDTCNLTDAIPFCKLLQSSTHGPNGRYGATITASPSRQLMAIVGSTNGSLSGATSGVASGTAIVAIPNAAKHYYGWDSAINCQVIAGGASTLHVVYSGHEAQAYDTASLNIGQSIQIQVFNEPDVRIPASWQGGATITANNASADIICTVGNSNPTNAALTPGDWTTQYNAFNK
jgi:hypothetical protein